MGNMVGCVACLRLSVVLIVVRALPIHSRAPNASVIGKLTPFLVAFRVASVWPIEESLLESDLTSAFNRATVNGSFVSATVHITNKTCEAKCPRKKRSSRLPNNKDAAGNKLTSPESENSVDSVNKLVFGQDGVYYNATHEVTGAELKKENANVTMSINNIIDRRSVREASTAAIEFAVYQGTTDNRNPIQASSVKNVYKLYASLNALGKQLKSVDEVLSFPIPLAEFSTQIPPSPPSSPSSLLIPPWAIFLIVFLVFLLILFIIWLVYSSKMGVLKDGGAALLVDNDEPPDATASKGPSSHQYNINVHKQQEKIPTLSTRNIKFDRSTSYDVGLLVSTGYDKLLTTKGNPIYSSPYKKKESRVQSGPIKKKINQRKQLEPDTSASGLPAYKSKFMRLNSIEKSPSYALLQPSPSNNLLTATEQRIGGNDSLMKTNCVGDEPNYNRGLELRDEETPTSKSNRGLGITVSDSTSFNQFYCLAPVTPYPLLRPLNATYPHPLLPVTNQHQFIPYLTNYPIPGGVFTNSPLSHTDSPKFFQNVSGDFDDRMRTEKIRKMARGLVEDAFDDSGFSTDNVSGSYNINGSFDKPADIEEFRRVLDEAFAFCKTRSNSN